MCHIQTYAVGYAIHVIFANNNGKMTQFYRYGFLLPKNNTYNGWFQFCEVQLKAKGKVIVTVA